MNSLRGFRQRINNSGVWGRSHLPFVRCVLAILAFLLVPLSLCLSEPRTLILIGYLPDFSTMPVLVLASSCLVGLAYFENVGTCSPAKWAAICLVLVPFVLAPEARAAFILLGCAGLLSFGKSKRLLRLAVSCWFPGIIFSGLWISDLLYGRYESQVCLNLSMVLAWLTKLASFGLLDVGSAGSVVIPADGRTEIIQLGLDKFGGLYFLGLVVLTLLGDRVKQVKFSRTLWALGAIVLYASVRCILAFAGNSPAESQNWWDERSLMFTYAPLAAFLGWRFASLAAPVTVRTSRSTVGLYIAAAGAMCVILGFMLPSFGVKKSGYVVLDESHSDWENSLEPIDDQNFGTGTVYNYYNFREELARHFPVRVESDRLNDSTLRDASVLILKTPTKPYSPEAVESIVRFVNRGGGLWLIGDHTDAFGMSTFLNQIASRFGCKFRINAWVEPPIQRNLWQGDLATHPIVQGLGTFLFYTGCELEIQPSDVGLMVGRRMIVEGPDYSAGSFFGPLRAAASNRFGPVIMAGTGERGRGRILLWADSTVFSNFVIYFPGKLELTLNSVEWLNNSNAFALQRPSLLASGLILTVTALLLGSGLEVLLCVTISMGLAPLMVLAYNRLAGLKEARTVVQGHTVSYLELAPTFHLPHYAAVDGEGPDFYVSAYIASQRVKKRPILAESLESGFRSDTMVLLPPPLELGENKIQKILSWVSLGGKLIILDGGKLRRADAERFALGLGIGLTHLGRVLIALRSMSHVTLGKHITAFLVQGGKPLIEGANGETVCSQVKFGNGSVIMSGTNELFSDESLGDVLQTPDQDQINMSKSFCDMLR